jgi:hypothetical protein
MIRQSITRGQLLTLISYSVAIALVSGLLVFAVMFPELLPWYTGPSQRFPARFQLLGLISGLKR